jgi:hypothetical protein
MSDSFIRINGKVFDHGSVEVRLQGEPFVGIKEVKYDQKRNRVLVRPLARNRRPKGKSAGEYEPGKLVITMLRRSAQDLRDQIAKLSEDGDSYGDPGEWVSSVQYIERGMGPIMDSFEGCWIEGDAGGTAQGPDPLYEDVTIGFEAMKRNGKYLYSAS